MLNRRDFFKTTAGSLAANAAAAVGPMKIVKIEAVRFRPDLRIQGLTPNWMWVRLHTDTGIVGIGESYPGYEAHRGALKELAGYILGKDPTAIERLWQDLFYRISYQPWGGAETRMLTAINIAQWDILDFCRNPNYKEMKWPDDYWPNDDGTKETWDRSVKLVLDDLQAMREIVSNESTDLFAKIPHGTGQTILREALLLADHNSNHLGALILMSRILRN